MLQSVARKKARTFRFKSNQPSLAFSRLDKSDQIRRSKGRRIGVLGGSFNPAHIGHRHISLQALRRLDLDEVWWLLSPQNPLKVEQASSEDLRFASCLKLTRHPRLFVTRFEFGLATQYTADTLTVLKREFCAKDFVWLMGADNLLNFHKWHRWQEIAETVPIGIMSRPGSGIRSLAGVTANRLRSKRTKGRNLSRLRPPAWRFVTGPRIDISSTELRNAGLF